MTGQPGRAGPSTTAAAPGAGSGGFLTRIAARAAGAGGAGRLRPRPLSRFEPVPDGGGAELDTFPAGAAFDLATSWTTSLVTEPAGPSSGFGLAAAAGVPSVTRPGRGPWPVHPASGPADALPLGTGRPVETDPAPAEAWAAARPWWVEAPAEAWSGRAGAQDEPLVFPAPAGEAAPPTGDGAAGPAAAGRPAPSADARRSAGGGRDAGASAAGPAARPGRTGGFPAAATAGGAFDERGPAGAAGPALPEPAEPTGRRERWAPPGRRQSPAPAPVVHVTIGRVEVRAVAASATPVERVRPEEPAVATLDQYLRNRARSRG
ncbi:hypothetical protein [Kitasatospora sp. NPDC090091]|uniref:hypothetical protein n=1 Tax=Kitasatospora sp. NPDC090091 TaxID=3364081 RepID=UPI0038104649